jgi:PAS domain S-box-containing protein
MSANEDEEKQLRSAALQNASAILHARQRIERDLARERELLKVTLACIGDAVISTDAEARVVFLNGVAEALTGWKEADAIGRTLSDVFHIVNEHSRLPVENPALRALHDGIVVGLANHTILIAKDGTELPIDDSASPIRDESGVMVGAVLVFRDVSERKRAEEDRARLAAIVESSDDAILSKSLEGIILSWNVGAQRLFGYTAAEAVGKSVTLIIPPERQDEERGILERLCRGERVEHFETVRVAKSGKRLDISLTISPIRNAEGRVIGASKIGRDITERVRVERALRESEERYRTLFEAMAEGFCVVEMILDAEARPVDYRFMVVNPMFEAHTGLKNPLGRTIREMVPDHEDHWFEIYGRVAATGEPVRFVNEAKAMGRWFEVYAYPLGAPGTRRVAILFTDITERKRTEEKIARLAAEADRERRLFNTVLSSTPDFNYSFDLNGRFTYVNDALLALWQKDLPNAVGKNFFELDYPPELAARLQRQIRQVIDTRRPIRDETPFTGASGEREYEYIFVPVFGAGGTVEAVAGSTRDMTDRKRAEEALSRVMAESEKQRRLYEAVLSGTPDFIYVFTLDYRVSFANDALLTMWGTRLSDTIGKTFLELGYEPWHAEMHCREIDQVVATKRPIRGEVPFNGTHGRRIYDYIFVPVIGADGEVEAVAGTTRDVTDRKQMEDALREADRKKDDFIALLGHELRNPLAPIRNGLQVIRMSERRDVRTRSQDMMERQLSHMVRLIDDLLDVSRISRNKMELRRTRLSLADVVESAVETARPLIDSEGHELIVSLPAEPIHLNADLTRLAQVFSNLLTNSAKYTERGGRIWLSAERRAGEVIVTVSDTGIGIPVESLGSIFDMFSQVDRTTERSTGGLGIGLALVQGLVEMHGGRVKADSEGQGRGSRFTVALPILPRLAESPSLDGPSQETHRSRGRRILVVDDNRDSATSMAMMLELLGNEIRTAHDGAEAIERADSFRPEVILMDVGMPKMNGYEATRAIREQPWGKAIRVIALTGWGQEGDRAESKEAGCEGHLVKPVSLPDLEKLLFNLESQDKGKKTRS